MSEGGISISTSFSMSIMLDLEFMLCRVSHFGARSGTSRISDKDRSSRHGFVQLMWTERWDLWNLVLFMKIS